MRARGPAGMDIVAGEYGYNIDDFGRLLARPSVDVLQADATRCGGISGFLQVCGIVRSTARRSLGSLRAGLAPASRLRGTRLRHLEWFHDHVRIEHLLLEGAPTPCKGKVAPDLSRPGLGLAFKERDAEPFRIG